MVKKVVFVLSLFLIVDRVMYYKLGQGFHQTRQAFSSACVTHYHDQRELLKKRKIKDKIAFYTTFLKDISHNYSNRRV